jgi:NADH-quinone oxidoreductase subunit F
MNAACREAYAAGILGTNAMGTGKTVHVYVHKGAGAYICGEETALMNSLEGRRGNPRIKPPFPAVAGLFGQPTTINNVETLVAVPHILNNGAEWYKKFGRPDNPKSTGTKLFSVCGNIQRPGNYEVSMGFPFKDFLRRPATGAAVQGDHPRRHLGAHPDAGGSRELADGLRRLRRQWHHARLGRRDRDR